MSYILDALKKANQERNLHVDNPDHEAFIADEHPAESPPRSRAKFLIPTLLLLTLTGVGFMLLKPHKTSVENKPEQSELPPPTAIYETEPVPDQRVVPSQKKIVEEPPQRVDIEPEKVARPVGQSPSAIESRTFEVPLLDSLPFNIQSSVPEMQFSGHVYSSQPSGRMIMINRSILREKEYFSETLQVHEITPEGIIFKYRDDYFRVVLF
ncbi:MAG: hypothetical protein D6B25_13475 [Desulfobulbaceae bacterium]|nr:MAG: hypothetical protein D6B25_13475 [Desulfobulbaceae bacterium]